MRMLLAAVAVLAVAGAPRPAEEGPIISAASRGHCRNRGAALRGVYQ
jgi:hypothetical protein